MDIWFESKSVWFHLSTLDVTVLDYAFCLNTYSEIAYEEVTFNIDFYHEGSQPNPYFIVDYDIPMLVKINKVLKFKKNILVQDGLQYLDYKFKEGE